MKPSHTSIDTCCSEIQSNFEKKYLLELISSGRIEEAKKNISAEEENDNIDNLMGYIRSIEEIKSTISDGILYEKILDSIDTG